MPSISKLEDGINRKVASGVAVGEGTLIHVNNDGELQLADHSDSSWAHGFSFSSGAGTKTQGIPQRVRVDRQGVVRDIDYVSLTAGSAVYLGEDGKFATTGTQEVGIALDASSVLVDLDLQNV